MHLKYKPSGIRPLWNITEAVQALLKPFFFFFSLFFIRWKLEKGNELLLKFHTNKKDRDWRL